MHKFDQALINIKIYCIYVKVDFLLYKFIYESFIMNTYANNIRLYAEL